MSTRRALRKSCIADRLASNWRHTETIGLLGRATTLI